MSCYDRSVSDAERRARAEARRKRGVTVERIERGERSRALVDAPIEERLSAMTDLCLAAWRATGQPLPMTGRAHRADLPGEVYWPDHVERPPGAPSADDEALAS